MNSSKSQISKSIALKAQAKLEAFAEVQALTKEHAPLAQNLLVSTCMTLPSYINLKYDFIKSRDKNFFINAYIKTYEFTATATVKVSQRRLTDKVKFLMQEAGLYFEADPNTGNVVFPKAWLNVFVPLALLDLAPPSLHEFLFQDKL